jgi:hypothetical protein
MKMVVRCVGCGKMVGFYKSYKVHVLDRTTGTLTGETKTSEYEGKICRQCAIDAGYKVKKLE